MPDIQICYGQVVVRGQHHQLNLFADEPLEVGLNRFKELIDTIYVEARRSFDPALFDTISNLLGYRLEFEILHTHVQYYLSGLPLNDTCENAHRLAESRFNEGFKTLFEETALLCDARAKTWRFFRRNYYRSLATSCRQAADSIIL